MTSVVGILNKRGVAIAADSAVTRNKMLGGDQIEKVTNNGNKMIRLSNVDPVAVMITGNAVFQGIPWDVAVRRYRQRRGHLHHPDVEAWVSDFFDYLAVDFVFWDNRLCTDYLEDVANGLFREALDESFDENERESDGTMLYPEMFVHSIKRTLLRIREERLELAGSPHFESYQMEEFRRDAAYALDQFFRLYTVDPEIGTLDDSQYPQEVIDAIRPIFEETLLVVLGTRIEKMPYAQLVFAGYGQQEEYPSLVSATVYGGYAHRINFSIAPEDVVRISDCRPAAICPFAQVDVMNAILHGVHDEWSKNAYRELDKMITATDPVFDEMSLEDQKGLYASLYSIFVDDLQDKFKYEIEKVFNENKKKWESCVERYSPKEMASIADSLVDLTGLHRVMTFMQEGVGGIVDLAVITRENGFEWLRRKGWYHKDQHGKDGSQGI